MSKKVEVTPSQVQAARIILARNNALGKPTKDAVIKIAEAELEDDEDL